MSVLKGCVGPVPSRAFIQGGRIGMMSENLAGAGLAPCAPCGDALRRSGNSLVIGPESGKRDWAREALSEDGLQKLDIDHLCSHEYREKRLNHCGTV